MSVGPTPTTPPPVAYVVGDGRSYRDLIDPAHHSSGGGRERSPGPADDDPEAPVLVTWTVLQASGPLPAPPWTPVGAAWWQAGRSSPGRAQAPEPDGRWWSVVATWDDPAEARVGPPPAEGVRAWHATLDARSAHGDLVLDDGAQPFDALRPGSPPEGPAALITVAGASSDEGREREFVRRFRHVSRDVDRAPGHLLSLVQAPVGEAQTGPVLTFSCWTDLDAGLDWAYTSSRAHPSAVARQREHRLVVTSGSVRCAVVASRGTLGDRGDPLATQAPSGRAG